MRKLLFLAPTILFLAAACNSQKPAIQNNNPPQQAQPSVQTDETANWKTYTNSQYGFELALTDAWKGYKVFSHEGSQGVGSPTYLDFSVPTTDRSRSIINVSGSVAGYAAPLTITIIAKDVNYQGTGTKIAEFNDSVYYYSINTDLPSDLKTINFEIPLVISTFKLTNSNSIEYKNDTYGFSVTLPSSWQGYTIVNQTWQGYLVANENGQNNKPDETGPEILIRNPKWTTANPYQDIPIMVFTLAQWNLVSQEQLSLGAAPIGPSELGRNAKYVFALPARYNFAYPTGWEEVDKIISDKNNFKAF